MAKPTSSPIVPTAWSILTVVEQSVLTSKHVHCYQGECEHGCHFPAFGDGWIPFFDKSQQSQDVNELTYLKHKEVNQLPDESQTQPETEPESAWLQILPLGPPMKRLKAWRQVAAEAALALASSTTTDTSNTPDATSTATNTTNMPGPSAELPPVTASLSYSYAKKGKGKRACSPEDDCTLSAMKLGFRRRIKEVVSDYLRACTTAISTNVAAMQIKLDEAQEEIKHLHLPWEKHVFDFQAEVNNLNRKLAEVRAWSAFLQQELLKQDIQVPDMASWRVERQGSN